MNIQLPVLLYVVGSMAPTVRFHMCLLAKCMLTKIPWIGKVTLEHFSFFDSRLQCKFLLFFSVG